MTWFESLIAKKFRPEPYVKRLQAHNPSDDHTYLNEMPYCETVSKPDFHTNVTSQAFVA